jgi:hypothetical protein
MEVERFTIKKYTGGDGVIELELEEKPGLVDYKLTISSHWLKPEEIVIESIGITEIEELSKFLIAFLKNDAIDITEEE